MQWRMTKKENYTLWDPETNVFQIRFHNLTRDECIAPVCSSLHYDFLNCCLFNKIKFCFEQNAITLYSTKQMEEKGIENVQQRYLQKEIILPADFIYNLSTKIIRHDFGCQQIIIPMKKKDTLKEVQISTSVCYFNL